MPYHRIDPQDKSPLPDIETWEDYEVTLSCKRCGMQKGPEGVVNDPERGILCPSCSRKALAKKVNYQHQWYSWICVPGCDPDSDFFGPFDSEDDAVEAARAFAMEQE